MTLTAEDWAPHPVDAHVGRRIRELRLRRQVSQEQLGQALGITFQQVQKYERGANRVSASKLFEVAGALGVTLDYFFQGRDRVAATPAAVVGAPVEQSGAVTAEAAEIDRLFLTMGRQQRRLVVEMACALAARVGAAAPAEVAGEDEPSRLAMARELEPAAG